MCRAAPLKLLISLIVFCVQFGWKLCCCCFMIFVRQTISLFSCFAPSVNSIFDSTYAFMTFWLYFNASDYLSIYTVLSRRPFFSNIPLQTKLNKKNETGYNYKTNIINVISNRNFVFDYQQTVHWHNPCWTLKNTWFICKFCRCLIN